MKKCILVDGSGLIYRGFYAIPPFLKSPQGVLTNAVFGFTNILLSLLIHQKPDYLAVALDKKGPTFRHKTFHDYKATRVKAPQALYDQIPLVREVISTFSIPLFEAEEFEADDVLATIVEKLKGEKNIDILIATGDFDMFQTVQPHVSILYPEKGFKEPVIIRKEDIEKKYGLAPEQIPDFKGLAGDYSDNLPGIFGIGEKSARELLKKYNNLETIYEHLPEMSEVLRKKLVAGKDNAFLSKNLATLEYRVPIVFHLEDCRVKDFNIPAVRKIFQHLGFKNLQKRLDELFGNQQTQASLFE